MIVLAFPPLTRHRSGVKIGLYQKESVVMMKYGCYVGKYGLNKSAVRAKMDLIIKKGIAPI